MPSRSSQRSGSTRTSGNPPQRYPPQSFNRAATASSMPERPPTPTPVVPNPIEIMRQDLRTACNEMATHLQRVVDGEENLRKLVEREIQGIHEHMSRMEVSIEQLRDQVDNVRLVQEHQNLQAGIPSGSQTPFDGPGYVLYEEGPTLYVPTVPIPTVQETFAEAGESSAGPSRFANEPGPRTWPHDASYGVDSGVWKAQQQDFIKSADGAMGEWDAEIKSGKPKLQDPDWLLPGEVRGQNLNENWSDEESNAAIDNPDVVGAVIDAIEPQNNIVVPDTQGVGPEEAISSASANVTAATSSLNAGINNSVQPGESAGGTPAIPVDLAADPGFNEETVKGDLAFAYGECAGMLKILGRMAIAPGGMDSPQFVDANRDFGIAVRELNMTLAVFMRYKGWPPMDY